MRSVGLTIIGDSIIKNNLGKKSYDWSNQLTKNLQNNFNIKFFVKKKIVHGINSRGVLNLLPDLFYKIDDKFKDILILQVGINDSWHYNSLKGLANVPKKEFSKNLEEIYNKSKIYDFKKILFVNYHKIELNRKDGNNKTPDQNLKSYNDLILKFCRKKNIRLINISKISSKSKIKILLNDGVHLNLNGVRLYAKIIYKQIIKYL